MDDAALPTGLAAEGAVLVAGFGALRLGMLGYSVPRVATGAKIEGAGGKAGWVGAGFVAGIDAEALAVTAAFLDFFFFSFCGAGSP